MVPEPLAARKRNGLKALVAVALLLGVSGCGGLSQTFSMQRKSPDEYTVTTQAPLVIPNQFTLPPPTPDVPRPQDKPTDLAAEAALDPAVELMTQTATSSPGQQALVGLAGPAAAPNIREFLADHIKSLNRQGGLGNDLAFWKKAPIPGKLIDPAEEAARLRKLGVPTVSPPAAP